MEKKEKLEDILEQTRESYESIMQNEDFNRVSKEYIMDENAKRTIAYQITDYVMKGSKSRQEIAGKLLGIMELYRQERYSELYLLLVTHYSEGEAAEGVDWEEVRKQCQLGIYDLMHRDLEG